MTNTPWNSVINTRSGYVLYIETDHAPHQVSIHNSLSGAEAGLREYAEWFFGHAGEPVTANEDLVEKLAEFGEYPRIYKCSATDNDGNVVESIEIEPFVHPLDVDKAA